MNTIHLADRTHRAVKKSAALVAAFLLLPLFFGATAYAADVVEPATTPAPRPVRVGLYENRPKIYSDDTGAAAGIFPAILSEIAHREQWQVTYVPCAWVECLDALDRGVIDLMPDVAFSLERATLFDFHHEEVTASWSALYTAGKNELRTLSDLNGRRLAVLKGSIQRAALHQLFQGFGFTVTFVDADSFEEAFALAASGKADAVVANHFFGDSSYQRYGLHKTPLVFNPVSLYFTTAPGANHELLAAIDRHLQEMKASPGSTYYTTLVAWMERPPRIIVPPALRWIISGISVLLALALVFILLLRWQVKIATRDLATSNRLLSDSEKKFRDLFHRHTAIKLLIDPNSGAIVEANKAAALFYGWSEKQLRTMHIQDINTLSVDQLATEMAKARDQGSLHTEFRHRLADGTVRDVAVFCSKIEVQGKTLLHSIIHDITTHRNIENQLRQAQKMESVGRLAGGVAHDYNNMLSVIIGYTEMALRKIHPSDLLHHDLTEVLNAARRSAEITRQLLAFARKQTIAPMTLDLNQAVDGMLTILRRLIGEDINLTWQPQTDLWSVKIDPTQIDQILANLCVNARDAITDVGKIIIETDCVSLDAAYCAAHAGFEAGDYVRLCVSDDGCGMDRETLDHVFEPFFTTKGINEGTGLGLATVYGIVKQNNGSITIYSEPNHGTTIRIYLPRHDGPADQTRPERAVDIPQGEGQTILLVEDDEAIRKMCRKMLENLNYQVLDAGTPHKALNLAGEQAGAIALLVTDVVMPEMNGKDLACHLRLRLPDLKVLFMSGYTANVIAHRGVLEEGVHFIQKPFLQQDLAVKVRQALQG
jgi:two-component system sensor histidine kinase EvgS